MRRNDSLYFGDHEGVVVWRGYAGLYSGHTYEAPRQGVALFSGGTSGTFRAVRWELWQVM
jgi:hypothetical protein